MPRPDRGVAQRYAARKRKKRPSARRTPSALAEPIRSRSVDALDELPADALPAPLRRPEPRRLATAERGSPAARPRLISRRPFSSYAEEYRYVVGDLRRVALVAGSLLLALIVLSLFIH